MGTETIEEARRWVEYCNVKDGPYYAELRKKHGYLEPYNVKSWALGNEVDGPWQMGHLSAEEICQKSKGSGLVNDPHLAANKTDSCGCFPITADRIGP